MSASITRLFNLNALIIITLFMLTLGAYWINVEYTRAQKEIENIDASFIEEQKNLTKQQVLQAVKYIGYKRESLLNRNKEDIKQKVYEAHAIANSLHNTYRDTKSRQEIEHMVKEALRYKFFNNNRGYYFATNMNGTEELFADRPELEGKNLLLVGDANTRKVIAEMIGLVRTRGEGFYEYIWTKPGKQGAKFHKISYIKYFAPFDWFIGTGEYLEDIESDMQQETLQWIAKVKNGIDDYMFVFDDQGNCLYHQDDNLIGKNLSDLRDSMGQYIVKDIIEAGKKKGGGFVSYLFKKPHTVEEANKISYIYHYERWGWIVGSGFYTDSVEHIIAKKKNEFKQKLMRHLLITALIMSLFFFSVLLVNRILSNRLRNDFALITDFFKGASDIAEPLKVDSLRYSEFIELGACINSMIERKKALELALDETARDYQTLFENMIDGFALHEMLFDQEGNPSDYRFLAVNRAFETLTGLRAEDIVGKRVLEVMPDTEHHWIETYGRVVETGEPVHFENFSIALGRHYEVTAYKHKSNEFACIFVDITERVNMYKNLEELTRNLEEKVADEVEKRRKQEAMLLQQSKLAAMGEMLISISHHWRQPLNAIGLVVQSLEDYYENHELDRERIDWVVKTIMDRLNNMSDTINAFSNYLRRPQLFDAFDVCTAVSDTLRLVSEDLWANNIDFKYISPKTTMVSSKPDSLSCESDNIFISGDINHFNQVIISLINNAKEAFIERQRSSESKIIRGILRIDIEASEEKVFIRIQDNGGGIAEDIVDRIFEPFFTTKEQSYTLGLGLYMSKLIIEEQMKGRLWAENITEGAAFIMEIPRHQNPELAL